METLGYLLTQVHLENGRLNRERECVCVLATCTYICVYAPQFCVILGRNFFFTGQVSPPYITLLAHFLSKSGMAAYVGCPRT